jgi:hypothetical protein
MKYISWNSSLYQTKSRQGLCITYVNARKLKRSEKVWKCQERNVIPSSKDSRKETEGDIMCGASSHIVQSWQNVQRSEENDNQLEVGNVPRAAWREVTKGDPVKGHWEWVWKWNWNWKVVALRVNESRNSDWKKVDCQMKAWEVGQTDCPSRKSIGNWNERWGIGQSRCLRH